VALKALRALRSSDKPHKKLERELQRWAELDHKNTLPFYGVVTDIGPYFYMVSPWQENGNLLAYVKNNPQPRKDYLLRGAADGLNYLHSRKIVHGNVKCTNVLVSHEGESLICDFKITRIAEETGNAISGTASSRNDVRYLAAELIGAESLPATTYSDTYSFAMLIIECITEEVPFSDIKDEVTHARLMEGLHPTRPPNGSKDYVSDVLWDLMIRCWSPVPGDRPAMEYVHRFLEHNCHRKTRWGVAPPAKNDATTPPESHS